MNFLYFIPGEQREVITADLLPPPLDLTLAGLPLKLGPASIDCKKLLNGPGGHSGLLCVPNPTAEGAVMAATNFTPPEQEWEDFGAFWLGWSKKERPTPADLQRTGKLIEGHPMTLADGQEWHVPVVGPHYSRLPHVFKRKIKESGIYIADRYRELAAESAAWAVWLQSDGERPWTEVCEFVAKCLGLNYHLGLEEVGAMELLDTQNARDVLDIIVGYRDYKEELEAKKTE